MTPLRNQLSRRGFLLGTAGAGALAALTACGYQDDKAAGGGGTWTFTDDRGRKLEGERPTRIVAQVTAAAALWDFGVRPIGVFGPSKLPDGKPDPQVGAVDLNTVTSLGNVWGEFNYDKYVSLNPQLLISVMYLPDELWYVPKEQAPQIDKVAPSVGLQLKEIAMPDGIAKFAALAKALGADVDAPAVTQAKAAYERANAEFAAAAKKASGLKVLAVSAAKDALWAIYPPALPITNHLTKQGLHLVVPENPDSTGFYEQLSWENAGRYPADVILYDNRFGALTPNDLTGNPTWSQLPAVKAGRLIGWNSETPFSYQRYTELLTTLTTGLTRFAGA
ncbi:ABC transporter substrate-binding protein [Amycolatopsis anabasis]|uniref:ABC transporter substrate-binding protein n=1 Tax=Amycolatopsis anabasis TaxID=1840409 RepID=UPI001FECE338|nr:ABC transporter substrate-binding protein [Amycolatopsis anabasis]